MLCLELFEIGAHFSIQNPKRSYCWRYGPMARLSKTALDLDFDQCRYGLVPAVAFDDPKHLLKIKSLLESAPVYKTSRGLGLGAHARVNISHVWAQSDQGPALGSV